ncbi:hypothetical protein M2164_005925 [Streptomyces sp. SAI-208]|uniref:hypothetical protein n=1 Tax=Streptomyces sp. SAI-208 TaxID=2940550 RepID=UPI0024734117|nr:hypothetical protein [Streptomyces sp. SAI-208]MDH6610290.1 hypothetical protein [Streptomyces sp. SAI-208]
MIAFPRTDVPVPDAVADLSGRQLPERVRQARRQSWEACVHLSPCRHPGYEEGRQLALARIAAASKVLAAHNPNFVHGWGDLPGLDR